MLLGLLGGAGKALLGGRKKKQDGPRMARRVFKREGGRDIGEQEAPQQQPQPTTPLVPTTFSSSPKLISKATTNLGGKETLEGTAFRIKTSVVEIDTILKGSLLLDKMRERKRRQKEQARRNQEEKDLEKSKRKFPSLGRFLPGKAKSLWSRITNYFVTLFWGMIIMRLIKFGPALKHVASFVFGAMNFIIEWGGKLLNFVTTLVDGAFWLADKAQDLVGGILGKFGQEGFQKLSKTFVMLLNAALMAAMVNARVNMGLNRAAGARARNPGFWTTPQGRVPVTRGRGGTPGLGRRVPVTGGGRAPVLGGARPRVTSAAKPGLQALKGTWKTSAAPIIKRIPLVGALMDFAINVFLFGESPGRAAFKAIGAGLGAALLGGLSSIIPGIGTLIGAIAGGMAGDLLGGWIYDLIFGGGKGAGTGKVDEKTAGAIIQDFGTAVAAGGAAIWAADKALRSAGRRGRGIKGAFRRVRSGPLGKRIRGRRIKGRIRKPRRFPLRNRGAAGKLKGGFGKFAKANALTTAIFAGMEFADRKSMGQTNLQAGAGTAASTAGGLGGAWAGGKAGAILGAKLGGIIGSVVPGAGTGAGALIGGGIGGVLGMMIGGVSGSMLAGGITDAATGANNAQPGGGIGDQQMDEFQWMSFHKGGIVPMDMTAALKGGEIVIDTNSVGPAKKMLLAINEASGYQGVMDAISKFAPYESIGQKTVIVEMPSSSIPQQQSPNDDVSAMFASFSPSSSGGLDPFEILHKGV